MRRKIQVLVVDDSAFMRKSLSIMLQDDEDIEVIATARDGQEGYELARKLRPDIITLDIEMPRMNGIEALQKIMKDCPTPVLMVSSLTTEGAEATLQAMEYGAVDFIPKELSYVNINIIRIKEDLIAKVKEIVRQRLVWSRLQRIRKLTPEAEKPVKTTVVNYPPRKGFKAIGLGVSTGGPLSLQKVIPRIKPDINVPFFIVQHMPPKFTKSLAERLNSLSELTVKEAEDREVVQNNFVYIAPGGLHMTVHNVNGHAEIKISDKPSETLHKPSVDVLFNTLADVYGSKLLSVIMTGMGKDGLEGTIKIKSRGGYSIAQDEDSCVVYGMPKAIVDSKQADSIVTLEKIYEVINNAL